MASPERYAEIVIASSAGVTVYRSRILCSVHSNVQEKLKKQLPKPSKAAPAAAALAAAADKDEDDEDDDEDDEDDEDAGVAKGGTTADGLVSLHAQVSTFWCLQRGAVQPGYAAQPGQCDC